MYCSPIREAALLKKNTGSQTQSLLSVVWLPRFFAMWGDTSHLASMADDFGSCLSLLKNRFFYSIACSTQTGFCPIRLSSQACHHLM